MSEGTKLLREKILEVVRPPEDELQQFVASWRPLQLQRGAYFLEAGTQPERLGFVVSGVFRNFFPTLEGDDFIRNFTWEGQFVHDIAARTRSVGSMVYIEALEPAELLVLPLTEVEAWYRRHSVWQELGRLTVEASYARREWHTYLLQTKSGLERYQAFAAENPDLVKRVAQKHIARYLNLTPSALSRLINARD